MTDNLNTLAAVTQDDRDAANAYRDDALRRLMAGEPGGWKDTPEDHLVQAFARHRLSAHPQPTGDVGALVERLEHCSQNTRDEYLHELAGRAAAATILALTAEVSHMKARLERTDPEFDRDDLDGIACRDETIKLLDARVAALTAEVERVQPNPNGCEMPEVTTLRYINELRREEGDCVTILCDNPDFNGQPNNAIICNGGWTDYEDRRFAGETVLQCLAFAMSARVTLGESA